MGQISNMEIVIVSCISLIVNCNNLLQQLMWMLLYEYDSIVQKHLSMFHRYECEQMLFML
jgi:hypothetical protein